jgi:hypothetical protein
LTPPQGVGDEQVVWNRGANTLAVYPQVGGAINAGAANAALSLAAGSKAILVSHNGADWFSIVSA